MLRTTALYFGSFVLKPNLNASGGHPQLISELDPSLLVGHLVRLEDLLQDCELVRASPLPLLLVDVAVVVVLNRELDPIELEQDHCQQHDLPFIVFVIVQIKLNELLALGRKLDVKDTLRNTINIESACGVERPFQ